MRIHSFYDPNSQMARHKWPKCVSMKAHFFLLCNFVVNPASVGCQIGKKIKANDQCTEQAKTSPLNLVWFFLLLTRKLIDSVGNGVENQVQLHQKCIKFGPYLFMQCIVIMLDNARLQFAIFFCLFIVCVCPFVSEYSFVIKARNNGYKNKIDIEDENERSKLKVCQNRPLYIPFFKL